MSNELIEFVLVSIALLGIGIYGLSVKRNAIRMLFAVEIIVNAANLNLVAFARFMPHSGGQTLALFSIAIAAAEVTLRQGVRAFAPKFSRSQNEEALMSLMQTADLALADAIRDIGDISVSKKATDTFFRVNLLAQVTQFSRNIALQAASRQIAQDLKTLHKTIKKVSEDIEAGLRAEAYLEEHREDLEEAVTAALGFIKERQAAVRAVVGSDESSRN